MSSCPSAATLARLGGDSLPGAAAAAIEEHIEQCPRCQSGLERLVGNLGDAGPSLPRAGDLPRIPGFVIEHELGRGNMSVVYQAVQSSLNRRVALKVVQSGPASGARDQDRWLHEARACSRVRHPNVVPLYDAAEANGWLYLVLEIVPGGTLERQLSVPYAARDAAALVEAIAGAVAAIHATGLLHLDLKPSNILLDAATGTPRERAIPRVTDFGIAFRWNDPDATIPGAGPLGTPWYMAPEQVVGDHTAIGPEADVCGLGALLYHVLTGRPPLAAPSVAETLEQVRGQDPVPPRRLNPALARDLETICLKCLEKDPGRRYASAEALAADLRSWIDGRPIKARPASLVERGWRSCRRRPVVAALAAALTLTLAVGFVAVVVLWRQAETARLLAEANFRTSNEALRDLVDLSDGGENRNPKTMTLDRLIALRQQIRKRLLALATRRPDDLSLARLLAWVEHDVGVALWRAGRNEDARTVALGSLAKVDALVRRYPTNEALRGAQCGCLLFLSEVSDVLGKKEDAVTYQKRAVLSSEEAIRSSEEAIRLAPTADMTAELVLSRRKTAWLLHNLGDFEKAGALFAGNRRLLRGLPSECERPNVPFLRLQAHIDSKLLSESSPWGVARKQQALDSGDPALLSAIASPTDASQSPEEWARLAALVLRSRNANLADRARCESENALALAESLYGYASILRRNHNIEGARRVAERMRALGNLFVATYPDQAAAHLTLSHAYSQFCKNAWQIDDRAAIESNLRAALNEAQEARLRDLTSEIAQQAVYSLQRRLADLTARSSENPAQTAPATTRADFH